MVLLNFRIIRRTLIVRSSISLLLTAATLLFCTPFSGLAEGEKKIAPPVRADENRQPDASSFLPGRTWQLIEIASMNDQTDAPDEPSLYTVEFKSDGSARIRADCNHGKGSWQSAVPGQLQFGPIASTRAQCPPGSLHDLYMAQFPHVRSYVVKGDHLFLATMADGAIIEFAPVAPPLAATVLGEEIQTGDGNEMREILLIRLFNRYAEDRGIEVREEEVDSFIENLRRKLGAEGLTSEKELNEQERSQLAQIRREMGRSLIRRWKLNRELYRQYGGRIIYQQFGPEPLDAYRQYLEERRDAGDFTILHKPFEKTFWHYFTTDAIHDFYRPGSREEARAFSTPPWDDGSAVADTGPGAAPAIDVPVSPDEGGPLNWQVHVARGGLNLRAEPSTSATILDTYPAGTILDNLGCHRSAGRVWCDVQRFGGGPRGYVAAEYLAAALSPNGAAIMGPDDSALRAGRGEFDATGPIQCAQFRGVPMQSCQFGVARKGGGYATVIITRPDGSKRAVFFRMGVAIGADTSQADGYPEFKATKENDLYLIGVGEERYEIPEAVIFGG